MEPSTMQSTSGVDVRRLVPQDLDAVVALDRRITGGSRRGYFEKRLAAALRQPKRHLQLAAAIPEGIVGFLLARVVDGEYGRTVRRACSKPSAWTSDPPPRAGSTDAAALGERLRAREVGSVVTQADWRNHSMLSSWPARFTSRRGTFSSARCTGCPCRNRRRGRKTPPLVRHFRPTDLEMVARIDRRYTGQDRGEYLPRQFDEVLRIGHRRFAGRRGRRLRGRLRDGARRFRRLRPRASSAALDTLGVNPGFAQRLGRAAPHADDRQPLRAARRESGDRGTAGQLRASAIPLPVRLRSVTAAAFERPL